MAQTPGNAAPASGTTAAAPSQTTAAPSPKPAAKEPTPAELLARIDALEKENEELKSALQKSSSRAAPASEEPKEGLSTGGKVAVGIGLLIGVSAILSGNPVGIVLGLFILAAVAYTLYNANKSAIDNSSFGRAAGYAANATREGVNNVGGAVQDAWKNLKGKDVMDGLNATAGAAKDGLSSAAGAAMGGLSSAAGAADKAVKYVGNSLDQAGKNVAGAFRREENSTDASESKADQGIEMTALKPPSNNGELADTLQIPESHSGPST